MILVPIGLVLMLPFCVECSDGNRWSYRLFAGMAGLLQVGEAIRCSRLLEVGGERRLEQIGLQCQ